MVLEMVAWRDPNLVPIKAFYGHDLKVNFCGKLATDTHVQVHSTARHGLQLPWDPGPVTASLPAAVQNTACLQLGYTSACAACACTRRLPRELL